jgi:hypothetical protein
MTDMIESARFGKQLMIGKECNRGGQGRIRETNDPCILHKQFEPGFITDDAARQERLQHKMDRAYQAFSQVNKNTTHVELKSLPREYVRLAGKPGYLMEKAEGQLLWTLLRGNAVAKEERLPLACAVARAFRRLRDAQLAHGDPHTENFFALQTPTGWVVPVIDIDGGGLLGPPGPIDPMSQPKRLYKAPELFSAKWPELRARGLFFAPDAWALAVLLYQLLVDYQGPFCSARVHPNPAVTMYVAYAPYAYRDSDAVWPQPWQEALLTRAGLPDTLVSYFYAAFQHRFILAKNARPRPSASDWETALQSAITPPLAVPVHTVKAPPPVIKAAPPRRRGRAAQARRIVPALQALLTQARRTRLSLARAASIFPQALAGTVGGGV